jgi:hypothetical protein
MRVGGSQVRRLTLTVRPCGHGPSHTIRGVSPRLVHKSVHTPPTGTERTRRRRRRPPSAPPGAGLLSDCPGHAKPQRDSGCSQRGTRWCHSTGLHPGVYAAATKLLRAWRCLHGLPIIPTSVRSVRSPTPAPDPDLADNVALCCAVSGVVRGDRDPEIIFAAVSRGRPAMDARISSIDHGLPRFRRLRAVANGVDGINTSSTPGPCFTLPSSCPYQRRCADGYRGDSLSLDLIDEWGLSVRGLDGLARVSATR